MNTNTWQFVLVVTGGIIGIVGALASSLTAAFLAERKLKLELRNKLQELSGNRQALEYLVGKQGTLESFSENAKQQLLKLTEAERLAFAIGFLTRANDKYETDSKELMDLTRSAEVLKEERDALVRNKQQLEQQIRALVSRDKASDAL